MSLEEQLKKIPSNVRPIVKAPIKTVKAIAPKADEVAYRSQAPRSKSAMWKLVRYAVDGANDVANSFSTSVSSRSLTLRQAALIATFCEVRPMSHC